MMERLNIKREKIADIQDVIYEGDINKDGVLDFEEWRTKMKKYVTVSLSQIILQGGPKNGATLFFRNTAQICTIFLQKSKSFNS